MTKNPDLPDQTVVVRRRRFERLYAAQQAHVFGYVLRRTERAEDAADVIAEVFLVAWRRLDDAPAGDGARLWLYGIARRALANYRRGQRRRNQLADRLRSELAGVPDTTDAADGEVPDLTAVFSSLPDGDREVLALEAWEELDAGEIATVLGCSRNAARIRLHRARRRLRDAIDSSQAIPEREEVPPALSRAAAPTRVAEANEVRHGAGQSRSARSAKTIVIRGDAP